MGDYKQKIDELIKKCRKSYSTGNMQNTLKLTTELLDLAKKSGNKFALYVGYNYYGTSLIHKGKYYKALEAFLKALSLSQSSDKKKYVGITLRNIGSVYGILGNTERALESNLESLKSVPNSSKTLNNLGTCYKDMEDFAKAIEYYEKAYEISQKNNEISSTVQNLLNQGVTYAEMNELDKSDKKLKEAYKIAKEKGFLNFLDPIIFFKAKNFSARGNYDKALDLLHKYLESSEKNKEKSNLHSVYKEISEIYFYKKDLEKAYFYQNKYIEVYAKIFNRKSFDKLSRLQHKYEYELEESKKKQSKLNEDKKATESKLQQLISVYSQVNGIGKVGIFSPAMKEIVKVCKFLHEDRSIPVLIEGETGTGKEIIARIVHNGEEQPKSPFIVLNCSAISASLFESELFGYEEGAFTGAKSKGKVGKFELAQGGTLFLDEIGELPLELQPKLLRALQQKEIYRIGGTEPIKLDVRIICATNRNLKEEIKNGNFRSDLFYRMNTGRLYIPPLRERIEEVGPLAQLFLTELSHQKNRHFKFISSKAVKFMETYSWPGNVRELKNTIERVILLYDDSELKKEHLSFLSGSNNDEKHSSDNYLEIEFPEDELPFSDIELKIFKKALKICKGSIPKTAKYLKISKNTLYRRKIKK